MTAAPLVTSSALSLIVQALVSILAQDPALADHVVETGQIPTLLARLGDSVGEGDTRRAILSALVQLINKSRRAVEQLAATNAVEQLVTLLGSCIPPHVLHP